MATIISFVFTAKAFTSSSTLRLGRRLKISCEARTVAHTDTDTAYDEVGRLQISCHAHIYTACDEVWRLKISCEARTHRQCMR